MAKLSPPTRVAVIWIDWYAYHVARFRGLVDAPTLAGGVSGVELVGGIGVHAGLKFREELPADLPIETLMPESSWREVKKFELARRLWAKLSELKPELVMVPGYYTLPGFAAALWARTHGAVSVLMTESTAYDHRRTGWKEAIKGWGLRLLFDWAIAGGRAHVEYLHQLGFPSDRIVGCYDVVDNGFFGSGTKDARLGLEDAQSLSRPPSFLYVGRLAEEKNVFGLLQSWLAYRANGGTWPLVLVGDGPEAALLRNTAAESGLGADVTFPGLKSSRELLPFYAAAGCFVLPSTREPWGLVVNEAMAAGLPVLVSDRCGCAPDLVVEGENGFLFHPMDLSRLTSLLHQVEGLSTGDREKMGAASERIIQGFSPSGFGASIASIYQRSARTPRGAARGQRDLDTVQGDAR